MKASSSRETGKEKVGREDSSAFKYKEWWGNIIKENWFKESAPWLSLVLVVSSEYLPSTYLVPTHNQINEW